MVTVLIKTDSHYRVNRERVRKVIEDFVTGKKFKGMVEVSVNIVGNRKMLEMNKKYRGIFETTDVLSFPFQEEAKREMPFIDPPDGILRLGDIVISYPQVVEDAVAENCLVDGKIDELVRHGMGHLMGNHHEEAK